MLGCQRLTRHILYGSGFGGAAWPFFAVGWFLTGVLVTYMLIGQNHNNSNHPKLAANRSSANKRPVGIAHDDLLPLQNIPNNVLITEKPSQQNVPEATIGSNKTLAGLAEDLLAKLRRSSSQQNDGDIIDLLARNVRILCMVLTTEKYHTERAIFVKQTWGQRCTKLIFLSDVDDQALPAIKASSNRDYAHVWSKVRGGFRWAYNKHINDFDWFMKADDDTYFILENLRALLVEFNPDEGVYVGHEFGNREWSDPQSYYSGGSGYVLSRRAVIKLVEEAFPTPKYCSSGRSDVPEDVEMGRCLEHVGIRTRDTRDDGGRQRFLPLPPNNHLTVGFSPPDFWIWTYDKYPYKEGEECCSSLAISFHYITPIDMIQFEYLVHRVHLFGSNVFNGGTAASNNEKLAYNLILDKLQANYKIVDSTPNGRKRFFMEGNQQQRKRIGPGNNSNKNVTTFPPELLELLTEPDGQKEKIDVQTSTTSSWKNVENNNATPAKNEVAPTTFSLDVARRTKPGNGNKNTSTVAPEVLELLTEPEVQDEPSEVHTLTAASASVIAQTKVVSSSTKLPLSSPISPDEAVQHLQKQVDIAKKGLAQSFKGKRRRKLKPSI